MNKARSMMESIRESGIDEQGQVNDGKHPSIIILTAVQCRAPLRRKTGFDVTVTNRYQKDKQRFVGSHRRN